MGKLEKDKRKYRKHWESADWAKGRLQHIDAAKHKNPNDLNEAHCKVCDTSLRAHLTDFQKHARLKKHQEKAASLDRHQYKTLIAHGYTAPKKAEKIADIKLVVYIVMHASIQSIDHLGELLTTLGKGSDVEKLRLHRTKCSNTIKHVVAPVLLNDLVKAVGDNGYSIIIDESTDVSITKYLCICINYFDTTVNRLLIDFLGIIEVERATAEDLYTSIVEYFEEIGLKLENLVGIGTDGASNLCGRNHSVYTLLRKDVKNLQLVKCTCHSLHLCASKASEELPSSLDFMAREIYNWFSVSSLRRITYKKTCDLMNTGNDSQQFRQMIELCRTRWLAFYEVVKRLLEQREELKIHFRVACSAEKCYTARIIRDMFDDGSNRLYFILLKPILAEVQHLNLSFQNEKVDVGSMYEEMSLAFLMFVKSVLKPVFLRAEERFLVKKVIEAVGNDLAFLPVTEVDLGAEFSKEIAASSISPEIKLQVKQRCFNFLRRLLTEMAQRLPQNFELFKQIKSEQLRLSTSREIRRSPIQGFL